MKTNEIRGQHSRAQGKPVILAASLCLALAFVVQADDVIKETAAGGVNWTEGVVFAHGFGSAKPNLSKSQKRILSRRAAVVDAQRNLLEMTKGVRINSGVTVDDTMKKSLEVVTRVEGIVKGAQIINEHFQNDVSTVTMAMPIAGRFLKVMLDENKPTESALHRIKPGRRFAFEREISAWFANVSFSLIPEARAAEGLVIRSEAEVNAYIKLVEYSKANPGTTLAPMLEGAIIAYETNSLFSGLLIDASAVSEFELATIPNIRDDEGNLLYPSPKTSYDDIVNKRGVTYDFDIQDAVRNKRVATTPFIIKAVSTYKSLASDLVISSADADRITQSTSTVEAMNKAGVLIVVAI